MHRLARVAALAAAVSATSMGAAQAAFHKVELLMKSGDVVPGTGGATILTSASSGFFNIAIGETGTVIATSSVSGTGITTSNDGVLVGFSSKRHLVAWENAAGPEGIGAYNVFTGLAINPSNQVSFSGTYKSGTPFGQSSGTLGMINGGTIGSAAVVDQDKYARAGDAYSPVEISPGVASTLSSVTTGTPRLAGNGTVIGRGQLTTVTGVIVASPSPGNRDVLFTVTPSTTNAPGTFNQILRTGAAAPGFPSLTINSVTTSGTVINGNGQYANIAQLAGAGVGTTNDNVLYTGTTTPTKVIRESEPLSGTPYTLASLLGSSTEGVAINNAGNIAYLAQLTGPGITSANDNAVIVNNGTTNTIVLQEGASVPGTGGVIGGTLPFLTSSISIAGDNTVSIGTRLQTGGTITSANDDVLLLANDGDITLLAREGSPAPGTDGNFSTVASLSVQVNALGQAIFSAALATTGSITSANDRVLYLYDPAVDQLTKVLQEGDLIEVTPGDFRTVSIFGINTNASGGQDGRGTSLNDNGQFSYYVRFTDNTTAWYRTTIPEPSMMGLLALPAMGMLRRRR